jgi:hypothetical protein
LLAAGGDLEQLGSLRLDARPRPVKLEDLGEPELRALD